MTTPLRWVTREKRPVTMTTPWRWVLLALVSSCCALSTVPRQECPQLMYVAGNHDYRHVEGLYLLQDDLYTDDPQTMCPVYRHTCHDNYLYYHPTHAAWWIGPELGALSGYALSYLGEAVVSRFNGPWLYWSPTRGEWYEDTGARVVCLNISCQRLSLSGHLAPNLTTGEYHLTDTIHYDRPVYKNHATGLVLYHNRLSRACNIWQVGQNVGSEDALMYVYDAARDPVEINANWTLNGENSLYGGQTGNGNVSVHLTCLETYKYFNSNWRTSNTDLIPEDIDPKSSPGSSVVGKSTTRGTKAMISNMTTRATVTSSMATRGTVISNLTTRGTVTSNLTTRGTVTSSMATRGTVTSSPQTAKAGGPTDQTSTPSIVDDSIRELTVTNTLVPTTNTASSTRAAVEPSHHTHSELEDPATGRTIDDAGSSFTHSGVGDAATIARTTDDAGPSSFPTNTTTTIAATTASIADATATTTSTFTYGSTTTRTKAAHTPIQSLETTTEIPTNVSTPSTMLSTASVSTTKTGLDSSTRTADVHTPIQGSKTTTKIPSNGNTQSTMLSTDSTSIKDTYVSLDSDLMSSTPVPTTETDSDTVSHHEGAATTSGSFTFPVEGTTVTHHQDSTVTVPEQEAIRGTVTEREVTYTASSGNPSLYNTTSSSNISDAAVQGLNISELPAACGEVKVKVAASFLISGQDVAQRGRWPWMVSLVKADNSTKCGAALVSARHLVTAAHCVDGSPSQLASYRVVLGATNRGRSEPGIVTRAIYRVTLHPNFTLSSRPFRLSGDVGLVELDRPVDFTSYIQPVCLPPSPDLDLPFTGGSASDLSSCYVTGFGYSQVDPAGRRSSFGGILQEQSVRLETIESCARRYFPSYRWLSTSDNVCVRPNRNAKVCKGDSGGPLMCRQGSRWTLVGVASWSIAACISGNFPSIYVDFRLHADWIRQTMISQSDGT